MVALDLHGTGFRPEHKIRLLRGGHEVTGLRITKQTLIDPGHLRVTVYVGADVPLGSYSLVLAEPTGALSEPVNFEVVL